jgi:FkbM family methyltransferase
LDPNPLHQLAVLRRHIRSVGVLATIQLRANDAMAWAGVHRPPSIEVKPKNAAHAINMRTRGSSDSEVFGQVFVNKQYELTFLPQPRVILDLGANVGYSSAFFLSKYPEAIVLAVEPDPSNYAICCRNLKPFGRRATVICGAVWPEHTKLVLDRGSGGDGREWATRVRQAKQPHTEGIVVDAYDISSLMELCSFDTVDLMKIDVERSELELFSRNTSWLRRVRNLCVELHGRDCEAAFFRALSAYSYDLSRSGEIMVCRNVQEAMCQQ